MKTIGETAYENAKKAAWGIWENLCDRSCDTDGIDDETRDEMIEEWTDIICEHLT